MTSVKIRDTSPSSSGLSPERVLALLPWVCAVLVGALALVVLAGWALGLPPAVELGLGSTRMMPWTALALGLLALGIALREARRWRASRLCGAAAGALGLVVLAGYALDTPLAFDTWLFGDAVRAHGGPLPGRMAPLTAVALTLLGTNLLIRGRWAPVVEAAPALLASALGLVGLVGHLYDAASLYQVGPFRGMATPTAVALVLLGLGEVIGDARQPVYGLLAAPTGTGRAARRLLPMAVALPILLHPLESACVDAGWCSAALALAASTVVQVLVLLAVGWFSLREAARSEGWLATTLGSIGDAVIATDGLRRVTYLNPVAERLTGWLLPEARGRPASEVFRVTDARTGTPLESPVASVLRDGNPAGLARHAWLTSRDGQRLPIADSAAPIRKPGGEIEGVVLIFRDVAKAFETESRLRLYADLVDHMHDGVIAMDPDFRVTAWNPAAERIYGWTAAEAIGQLGPALVRAQILSMSHEEALAQLASGKVVSALTRQLRKDGTPLMIQVVSAALTDETGQVVGCVGVHRDVTEEEALRARLAQTDRLAILGTLSASVGHEINNPLAFVIGNLELLLEQEDRAELREMAADALSGAERIRRIVADLKAMTRAEVTTVQELDVRRVVESAVAMASNQIRHSARLEQHLEPAPKVVGNESRLWQVVLNLLVNAAQAIPADSNGERSVSVTTYGLPPVQGGPQGGTAVIEVKDTGVGIPAELLPHVFDPFFTTQPIGHGTGLGLAICHGFVTAMGGTIEVESKVGQGTTVRVRLPGVPV